MIPTSGLNSENSVTSTAVEKWQRSLSEICRWHEIYGRTTWVLHRRSRQRRHMAFCRKMNYVLLYFLPLSRNRDIHMSDELPNHETLQSERNHIFTMFRLPKLIDILLPNHVSLEQTKVYAWIPRRFLYFFHIGSGCWAKIDTTNWHMNSPEPVYFI